MKAMIISFVCVLTFATQSLSAQNLTLEVRGIENVTGKLYVAIYSGDIHEEAAYWFCSRGEG